MKLENIVEKIYDEIIAWYPKAQPEISYNQTAELMSINLKGGSYMARNEVEHYFMNSKRYINVVVQNGEDEKHISFNVKQRTHSLKN